MSLHAVCGAIAAELRTLQGFTQVYYPPPPRLVETYSIVVYPSPGRTTPMAHSARGGSAQVAHADLVMVEAHWRVPGDEYAAWIPWATQVAEQIRLAIWSRQQRDHFGQSIHTLTAVEVDWFGRLNWNGEDTYGARIRVDLQHGETLPADRIANRP